MTEAPFPRNIVPQNRIDKNGQAILSLFPLVVRSPRLPGPCRFQVDLERIQHYLFTVNQLQTDYTHVFSPTVVNEMSLGYRVLREDGFATSPTNFDPVIRSKVGISLDQLYPEDNPLNIIPRASFGGVLNGCHDYL